MSATVTTVTTDIPVVVTPQAIDNKGCHDRHDRHDRHGDGESKNKGSLSPLAEKLRQRRSVLSTSETRRVHTSTHDVLNPASPTPYGLVTVVTVVTPKEISKLDQNDGRDTGRDGRDGQAAANCIDDDWNEVGPLDGFEPAPQSIPDARMIAGMLAASRVPAAIGGQTNAAGSGLTVNSVNGEAGASIPGSAPEMHSPVVNLYNIQVDSDQPPAPQSGKVCHSTSPAADPWAAGIAQLQRMPAPASFTPSHWQAIQRSCAILQDRWGPELRRLGWSTADAFGVHPTVGAAGLHSFGLGPLLGDAQVVDLTEARAAIVTAGRVRQSYTRRAMPQAVPAWEVDGKGGITSSCTT